jgi:hypothetical protein
LFAYKEGVIMTIYDRKSKDFANFQISMIRGDEDLHSYSPSTGEVVLHCEWGTEILWVGHAAQAGDQYRLFCELVSDGADVEDLLDLSD